MLKKKFEEIDNSFDKLLKQTEKKIAKEYADTLKALRSEMAELYRKHSEDGKLTMLEMQKYDRLKKMDEQVQESINQMFAKNRAIISSELRNTYTSTFIATKGVMEDATKKTLRAILKPVDVTKIINQEMAGLNWGARIGKQRSDLIYTVQKSIKEGLTQGDTYRSMANRIGAELGKDAPRAITIARTEGARVLSQAQKDVLDVAERQGVVMMKTFNSVRDERVRDLHQDMDGQTVPYDDNFVTPDGYEGKMPRLFGVAHHDINCRCWVSFELKTE